MDEKHTASSWDDLIKQVGAAPAPDATERKRSAIETTFEPPPAIPPSAVKPKASDWNALASDLGIEAAEPPAPERPRRAAADVRESDYGGPSSDALEASLAEIEPMESMFEEIIEEEVADIEFEADDSDLEDSDMSDSSLYEDDLAESTPRADSPERLSREAGESALDALLSGGSFGALPPQQSPPPRTPPRREPRAASGPQWRDPETKRDQPRRERDDAGRRAAEEPRDGAEPRDGNEDRSSSDESGRPRRRRRRGRGRSRDGASRGDRPAERQTPTRAEDEAAEWPEMAVGEPAGDDEGERSDESAAEGERPARRRRVRRRRRRGGAAETAEGAADRVAGNGRSREADDDADDAEDDELVEAVSTAGGANEEEDEDDDGEELPRESHKNIPTWAEAISVMVDANMQSRKNAPSRPSGSRERGRGRGRGRGGAGRRGKT